jgi:signal transduction histidine kinase
LLFPGRARHIVPHSLYSRLALALALLLLAFGIAQYFITRHTNTQYQEEVTQRLSSSIAMYVRDHLPPASPAQLVPEPARLLELFNMLMVVNPNVEAYWLDADGRVLGHAQPDARLARYQVDTAPLKQFLSGARLPLRADDPKSETAQHVFSVAPLVSNGYTTGYVYVVLTGEDHRSLAEQVQSGYSLASFGMLLGGVLVLALSGGLLLFYVITRRLRALTREVDNLASAADTSIETRLTAQDEINRLIQAFRFMAQRIGEQIKTIQHKDRQRRDMVAAVSHDLRTPLTSLRGYLDTLERKLDTLDAGERTRYVSVAARQCHKLCDLSEQLFQLAKLECEEIRANPEPFLLADLVQDVMQKFELMAGGCEVRLLTEVAPDANQVNADIGLIERVLVNLLDNALRHTPQGGTVGIQVSRDATNACIRVVDTGTGIDADTLPRLFDRTYLDNHRSSARPWGGLGLAIARRILLLHGSDMTVESQPGRGATFAFHLPLII